LDTGSARTIDDFVQIALDAADGRHIVVNPQTFWSSMTTELDDLGLLRRHVVSQVKTLFHQRHRQSELQLLGLIALALACLARAGYLLRRIVPELPAHVAPAVVDQAPAHTSG
jgi:hypothetical protein